MNEGDALNSLLFAAQQVLKAWDTSVEQDEEFGNAIDDDSSMERLRAVVNEVI